MPHLSGAAGPARCAIIVTCVAIVAACVAFVCRSAAFCRASLSISFIFQLSSSSGAAFDPMYDMISRTMPRSWSYRRESSETTVVV